jgi:hypothetical protein
MKNAIKLFGIIAFAAIIGFAFTACPNDTDEGNELEGSISIVTDKDPAEDGSYEPGVTLTAIYSGTEAVEYRWYKASLTGDFMLDELGSGVGLGYIAQTSVPEGRYKVTVKFGDKDPKTSNTITVKNQTTLDAKDDFYGVWKLANIGTGTAARDEYVTITKGISPALDIFDFFYSDVGATSSSPSTTWHHAHVDFDITTWQIIENPNLTNNAQSVLAKFTLGYKLSGKVKSKNGNIGSVPDVNADISYYVYRSTDKTQLIRTTPNGAANAIQNDSGTTRVYTKVTP